MGRIDRIPSNRPIAARWIAGVLAAGGTYFAPPALLFTLLSVFSFSGLAPVFLLGWFAFFALISAALGKRLPGDPWTTWLPCGLINAWWLFAFGPEINFGGHEYLGYYYGRLYVWTAVIGPVVGLSIELFRSRWPAGPQTSVRPPTPRGYRATAGNALARWPSRAGWIISPDFALGVPQTFAYFYLRLYLIATFLAGVAGLLLGLEGRARSSAEG